MEGRSTEQKYWLGVYIREINLRLLDDIQKAKEDNTDHYHVYKYKIISLVWFLQINFAIKNNFVLENTINNTVPNNMKYVVKPLFIPLQYFFSICKYRKIIIICLIICL